MYNDKYINPKIYLNNINFYGNETPEEIKRYTSLSVISLDSVIDINKKFHPHIFLEDCKYEIKKKKIMNAINEELNLVESDED